VALQLEDGEGDDAGDQAGRQQGHAEEQVQPQSGAHELGDVGGHRHGLGLQPQKDGRRRRVALAGEFRQVVVGDDAELGRQVLHEHGHEVGHGHDPQQQKAELGAAGHVGREVAGVDVGNRRNEGRPQHGQGGAQAATRQQRLERRDDHCRRRRQSVGVLFRRRHRAEL
jgi:hypothetical protein